MCVCVSFILKYVRLLLMGESSTLETLSRESAKDYSFIYVSSTLVLINNKTRFTIYIIIPV